MSYTAPQYVDTKEQAILALASTIADEDKSALGDGSVNRALDVLADVLAEQDVQVPQTDAGAILALASIYKPTVLVEKTVTANDTYVAADDDADGYSSVTVNVSGGGSSDFTTATVAYSREGEAPVYFACATFGPDASKYYFSANDAEGSFDVILYKGKAHVTAEGYIATVVSGDAEVVEGNLYVMGDCAITVEED